EELFKAGIEKRTVDGLRVTPPQALGIVRRVFHQQNLKLVDALHAMDTRATSVVSGVFEADWVDRERFGLVGKVEHIELSAIDASLRVGSIPIIASLGETGEGQILNINADFAANELVRVLKPYKIVFLTGTGGLLDENDKVIDSINLSTEYERFMEQPWLDGGMRLKLGQIADLLRDLPLSSSVSITRPAQLARELFTHKGSGTLVRRGEKVLRFESWSDIDLGRLRALVESSFAPRRLVEDYFTRTEPWRVYVSEHYRAAMILTLEGGLPYLDKFAVLEEAQGEGLGRAVWQVMRAETPQLFWRSRHGNSVNAFYHEQSDGCFKDRQFRIFWYGLDGDFAAIARSVDACVQREPTLLDSRNGT
ncbi:MAG: acetylglutamate kinase, partial [Rhodanobacteraceae bacterium]